MCAAARPVLLRLLVIGAGVFAPGCGRTEESRPRPSVAPVTSQRNLSRVRAGMTEQAVAAVVGPPDEVRTEDGHRPWIAGARFVWAYGVLAPGGFAAGGHVLFGDDRRVTLTRSPVDADPVRPAGTRVPFGEAARAGRRSSRGRGGR